MGGKGIKFAFGDSGIIGNFYNFTVVLKMGILYALRELDTLAKMDRLPHIVTDVKTQKLFSMSSVASR